MIASWGMRARRLRIVENMNAPRNVKARLTQYENAECGSPPLMGSRMAMVAPSAAICAQIGVDPREDQARDEWRREKCQYSSVHSLSLIFQTSS